MQHHAWWLSAISIDIRMITLHPLFPATLQNLCTKLRKDLWYLYLMYPLEASHEPLLTLVLTGCGMPVQNASSWGIRGHEATSLVSLHLCHQLGYIYIYRISMGYTQLRCSTRRMIKMVAVPTFWHLAKKFSEYWGLVVTKHMWLQLSTLRPCFGRSESACWFTRTSFSSLVHHSWKAKQCNKYSINPQLWMKGRASTFLRSNSVCYIWK